MVPPIVKQASLYGYNNHDFDFFITLAKHPRLTLRHTLLLVDLLGKICLNDPLFGRVATVPFLILAKKYGEDDAMHEYMERFAKVALSMFMHIESKQGERPSGGGGSLDPAHIRRTLIVETLAKLVSLRVEEYNRRLLPLLKVVDGQYAKQNNGRRHRNIAALRRMCGGEEGVELVPETEDQTPRSPLGGTERLDSVAEDGGDEYLDEVDLGESDEDDFYDDELDDDEEYQKAMESSAKEIDDARTLFELIDSDRDGVITKRELMHAATMSEDCMAIMQTNDKLQHLLQPQHFAESFKAMDIEHTGKITLDEFQTFAQHVHKKALRRKAKQRRAKRRRQQAEATSRPSSRASSAFDEALEESLETVEDVAAEAELEDEEPGEETKTAPKKVKLEDLSREERRALAMKKAQARRSNVQIGQRKVHLKIKKAAKSVQGDIDAAKKRLGKLLHTISRHFARATNIQDLFSTTMHFSRSRFKPGPRQRTFESASSWKRSGASLEAPRSASGCGKSFSAVKTIGARPGGRRRRRKSLA